jgi:hypothetical protein
MQVGARRCVMGHVKRSGDISRTLMFTYPRTSERFQSSHFLEVEIASQDDQAIMKKQYRRSRPRGIASRTSPSYSPKIAAWRDLRQDFARGAWRVDRVRRLMTRRLGLILLGWKFRRGVGCGDGAALAMALRRRAVRRVRGRQRGRDKRWARRHGCEPRLPPRARRS